MKTGTDFIDFIKSNEKHFIAGIYNYCDKWCEKCPFTNRCALYAMERVEEAASENLPAPEENEKFWKEIGDILKKTMELLFDLSKEKQIDLKAVTDDQSLAKDQVVKKSDHSSLLTKMSYSYLEMVKNWFDKYGKDLIEIENVYDSVQRMDPCSKGSVEVRDLKEIIQWYAHQSYVKLKRAEMERDKVITSNDQSEDTAVGSAKVAFIGYQRSMGAWGSLIEYIPQAEDDILNLLVQLERVNKSIEFNYPNVHHFRRPGFDDKNG